MYRHASSPGINEEALLDRAKKYDEFKEERVAAGFVKPVGEGVLIWDEVKVNRSTTKHNVQVTESFVHVVLFCGCRSSHGSFGTVVILLSLDLLCRPMTSAAYMTCMMVSVKMKNARKQHT